MRKNYFPSKPEPNTCTREIWESERIMEIFISPSNISYGPCIEFINRDESFFSFYFSVLSFHFHSMLLYFFLPPVAWHLYCCCCWCGNELCLWRYMLEMYVHICTHIERHLGLEVDLLIFHSSFYFDCCSLRLLLGSQGCEIFLLLCYGILDAGA